MSNDSLYRPVNNAAHKELLRGYGLFMVQWSVFESILDVIIERRSGLDTLHATIIVSGLGFERKASIVRSLLALEKARNVTTIALINKIIDTAGRNAIVHGKVHVGREHLSFVKYRTDQKLRVSTKSFTPETIMALIREISKLVGELQSAVEITDNDLIRHGDAVKDAVAKIQTDGSFE